MRGSMRVKPKETPTPTDIPQEQLNAKDAQKLQKQVQKKGKEIESLKRQLKLWPFLKNS